MKKFLYISLIFIGIIFLNSCSKEEVVIYNEMDPFAIDNDVDDSRTLDQISGPGNGTIVDPDEGDVDLDEDDDKIVDPDEDDDDMDEDDDEEVEGNNGNGTEGS